MSDDPGAAVRRRLAAAGLGVVLAACGGGVTTQPAQPPEGEPYIEGRVDTVTPFVPVTEDCLDPELLEPDAPVSDDGPALCSRGDEGPGSIIVVADDNAASLTISAETQLLRELGGGYEPAEFSQLEPGQTVAAWVSGPIAESFPVQATADAVVIRE